ncbi:hypothetical protein L6452_11669 [Arctium lappa]|uniref:Uncharacterized protein n=1 Tax=Arctium lappa TaxID=4217 RepID=A0ACB9DPX8_ARCLA|nr:hypothetical protein L6452_11669 [Arctium lappa]
MSLDTSKIETLTPSQFITFTIPNPITHHCYLRSPLLRVAVLDSPTPISDGNPPSIAGMIVPGHRESDWIFNTESGHFQLLHKFPNISRLILIGNNPQLTSGPAIYIRPPVIVDNEKLEEELKPYVIALHPTECFQDGLPPEPVFLKYEDNTLYRVTIYRTIGPVVGEFIVEDVEVESNSDGNKDFRRRLRFKKMPNLIQTQISIVPSIGGLGDLGLDLVSLRKRNEVEFRADVEVLVQPYLTAMVSGLFLIVSYLDRRIQQGFVPRALCLGVGGGALLSFLNIRLGFRCVGVEIDEYVLRIARMFFGLSDGKGKSIRLIVGDGVELIENVARRRREVETRGDSNVSKDILDGKFDVVMVDLDSSDATKGVSSPPSETVRKTVFQAARSLLFDHGVFVIKVVPCDELFHKKVIQQLKDVFHKVYEIDVGNERNFVLVATVSSIASNDNNNDLYIKMRYAISGAYVDSIKEL